MADQAASERDDTTGALDTDLFRLISSEQLQRLLDKTIGIGPKTLVLSPSLAGPLGLVTDVGMLKNSNAVTRIYWLEPGPLTQTERTIVYLCSPEVVWMKIIAEQIKAAQPKAHVFHLLVVPRMMVVCRDTLEQLGVLGSVEIHEYQLGLIPLEKDVLSLEAENVWKRISLDGDFSPVYDMAKAVMTIQRAFGLIPRIIGKGDAARRLVDLLHRLRRELPVSTSAATPLQSGSIDSMIVMDRGVDLVTPLCTQLTYEGLVDEVIGIKNSHVEVDSALINPAPAASSSTPAVSAFGTLLPKKKKQLLSSSDPLFAELRDKNFAVVGAILNRTARRLNDDYERRHLAKTPAELRAFVGQLGGLQAEHQALRLHTGLTEQIMAVTATDEFNTALEVQQNLVAGVDFLAQENAIRDLINQEAPMRTILRLLCLYSIVTGGLKPKVLEEFKRDILQVYGYETLPLLLSLSSLSLLSRASVSPSAFALARKPLRLIVDDVDEQDPTDVAYVFSGYAPLSVRLVQCAVGKGAGVNGWKGVEEVLKALPGVTFDERQTIEESVYKRQEEMGNVPTTIVCYLGGITYAEIAAIRFLNRQSPHRNFLIVTTGIIQGGALLASLQPQPLDTPKVS